MPVGKKGRTGEVIEVLAFVSPLIMVTSNSWSNDEVYGEKPHDERQNARPLCIAQGPCRAFRRGDRPNSELHTDLQLRMNMPERYTYRSATILDMEYTTARHYWWTVCTKYKW
jgi:hypothetical protein